MVSINCTKCEKPLKTEMFNNEGLSKCPSCGALLHVEIFPAFFNAIPPGESGEKLIVDDEAGCFYHPGKKAVMPCSMCGRFLCALCHVEIDDRHICVSCMEAGRKKKKIKNLENHRTLYDSFAFSLSILSMLIFYLTFITAPVVIYITIRYWKAPSSIIPRTKIRFVAAFIVACMQLTGWSFFLYKWISR